jgi:serine protease Do
MNQNSQRWRNPAVWTLAAALVLGGLSTASIVNGGPKASVLPLAKSYPAPKTVVDSTRVAAPAGTLKALDEQFAELAERALPAVVSIRVEGRQTTAFGENVQSGGEGSGVIFRPDGYIITNDHVVGGMDKVTVVLHDGREFPGKVTRAPENDIAVVKIDAKDLPTLPLADSRNVKVGQMAMAIGAPFGLENSVTIGHISATSRLNQIPDSRTGQMRIYWDVLQTDAPINMGNSGGPLISTDGEIIGINSAIQSMSGMSAGIGFSISSNQARLLAETLIEKGKVVRSFMGVAPEDLKPFRQKELNLSGGAVLGRVESNGPAAIAGLKQGDVIVRVGDMDIVNQADLRNSMLRYAPGSKVRVEAIRDGDRKSVDVSLVEPPKTVAQPRQTAPPEGGDSKRFNFPWPKDFGEVPMPDLKRPDQGDEVSPLREGQARLGVAIENLTEANRASFNLPKDAKGAVVTSIEPGSPAAKIGLQVGDLLTEVAGKAIEGAQDVRSAMTGVNWGDTKKVRFSRYTKGSASQMTVDVSFR